MKNNIEGLYTFTGVKLVDALKELDRLLPVEAYKGIGDGEGQKIGLTDINPAYSNELISELFGPVSLGWGYEELEHTDKGKTHLVKVKVWYTLHDECGKHLQTIEWAARGGSTNSCQEWAAKGALTNALGAAWSLQGLQASVYKGLRTHENVHKEWRDRKGETTEEPAEPAVEAQQTPEETPTPETPPPPEKEPAEPEPVEPPPAASKADLILGELMACGMTVSLSKDKETIYTKGKGKNLPGMEVAKKHGGKWDSKLPASVHKLEKDGAWVIPVPA